MAMASGVASSMAHGPGARSLALSRSPSLRSALPVEWPTPELFCRTLRLMLPNFSPFSSSSFSSPSSSSPSSSSSSLSVASVLGSSKRGFAVRAQSDSKESACFNSSKSWTPRQWSNGGGWFYDGANIDSSAVVEAGAVVHAGASVGPSSRIGSGSVVGSDVFVGRDTVLSFNVKLQNCTVGDRCVLHNGVAVGQDGFGFFVDDYGVMVKKPQNLRVVIGNDIEIGANTCIDRGSWRDTVIGDFTKIDNLVQIGHNVVIGRCCVICGQVGIGGSVTIGDYVVLAGQVGVADHVTITSKVRIGAKSGVTSNIDISGDYAGFPATEAKEWRRMIALQRRSMKKEKSQS